MLTLPRALALTALAAAAHGPIARGVGLDVGLDVGPDAELVADPVARPAAEPVAGPAAEPVAGPAAEPVAGPAGPPGAGRADESPLDDLEAWLKSYRRGRFELSEASYDELRALVRSSTLAADEARRLGTAEPGFRLEEALLDVAGLDRVPSRRRQRELDRLEDDGLLERVRSVGLSAVRHRLGGESGEARVAWLAELLSAPTRGAGAPPDERRVAAALALRERFAAPTLAGLLDGASSEVVPFREACREALCGWPDPVVHAFWIEHLDLSGWRPDAVALPDFLRHLDATVDGMAEDTQRRLRLRLEPRLISDDWREASRALHVSQRLSGPELFPLLIDSLEAWQRRTGVILGAKRMEHDLAAELKRRSGRALGTRVERWRNWWRLVQEGAVEGPPESPEEVGSVAASFFSLRPSTDSVTFVIDRSTSMLEGFRPSDATGEASRSRYDHAVEQMLHFLRTAGPETHFNVTLFSTETLRWKSRLAPASDSNLRAVEKWVRTHGPDGRTFLKEAILTTLELDEDGSVDLERLQSDTLIVLCDGKTSEGKGWVRPTLEAINGAAQVVFQCVQIGSRFEDDGTLAALAEASGGDFIMIEG